ncbi:MAG: hypothetical protein J0H94_01645 [Rhizobiales bacterium]|nr:hypothetical protein [Hyphomicrobiales bacterium]
MTIRTFAILAATLGIMVLAPASTFAGDAAKPTPVQIALDRSKAQVADSLVILGRSEKDPDLLMAAARILVGIKAEVADSKASASGKPVYYDVARLVEEAKGYPAKRLEVPPKPEANSGFCHYEYLCDSLSCAYEWVC